MGGMFVRLHMDKKIAGIQKDAAGMQTELGRIVIQTSQTLEDIQKYASQADQQSINIFSARIHFQTLKYREICSKMEQALSELSFLEHNGNYDFESLKATKAMLLQMITQAKAEENQLSSLEEEFDLAKHAVGIQTELKNIALLDKIKKGLEESRDTCG